MKQQNPRKKPPQKTPRAPHRPWLAPLLIFLIAFAFRLDTVFTGPSSHTRVLRNHEPQSVAESLVRTGQFANPFHTPTGPTAHLAPFQPVLSPR